MRCVLNSRLLSFLFVIGSTLCEASAGVGAGAIIDIGLIPGTSRSYGEAISADGTSVAGYATEDSTGYAHALRWSSTGGPQDLGVLSGHSHSYGFGISGNGSTVIGTSFGLDFHTSRAFSWTSAGMQDLGLLATGSYAQAYAISANGTMSAGFNKFPSLGPSHAVRWTPAGPQDLGLLPGTTASNAFGINYDGSVVVGDSGQMAFRWTASGGMQNLNIGGTSFAYGVSGDGQTVVGSAFFGTGPRAYRWTTGGVQDLGVIQGANTSQGNAASADGSIVVGTSHSLTLSDRAFIWTNATGMLDLNNYLGSIGFDMNGWILSSVKGISADGTAMAGEGSHNGVLRGWVVTGVPSPGTASIFVIGVLSCARRRRL